MNQVNIVGRLGKDPELKYTPNGKAVVKLSVAVNERYGGETRTYWFPVVCWNGLAETVAQYLKQGSKIAVNGRLISRSYDAGNGNRTVIEIIAKQVDFLDGKSSEKAEEGPEVEDEIPF